MNICFDGENVFAFWNPKFIAIVANAILIIIQMKTTTSVVNISY